MNGATDRLLIIAGCLLLMIAEGLQTDHVCTLLLLIVVASAGIYFTDKRITGGILLAYGLLGGAYGVLMLGLPLLFYEACGVWQAGFLDDRTAGSKNNRQDGHRAGLGIICLLVLPVLAAQAGLCLKTFPVQKAAFVLFLTAASGWIYLYNSRYTHTKNKLIRITDSSQELSRALKAKNRYLIEKQDTEIHMATLRERNRIAREIHDNVGHLLSRSILQTGAALAVNEDERLAPILLGLKDTLDSAMSSIRSSVHDLHEESVDLVHALEEIIKPLSAFTVHYEYDLSAEIPQNVKYCMISVVKEAVSNILKHSNGNRVTLILREHPAFYQILVKDNGTTAPRSGLDNTSGIGLIGMRERLSAFAGTIDIRTADGFCIFINIPKSTANKQHRDGD